MRNSILVVYKDYTNLIRVLNTETREVKNELQFPTNTKLEYLSDSSLVAVVLENNSIELRDTEKYKIKYIFLYRRKTTLYNI